MISWMVFHLQRHTIPQINPILHGGGEESSPPGRLSLSNRRWMPQMGWFFMTLFLPILERSWRGHFWKLFWKFQKFWRRQFFQNSIQRGDHSMQKSKSRKSLILFCSKSPFFYLNMNYKCSKISIELSDMSYNQFLVILRTFL